MRFLKIGGRTPTEKLIRLLATLLVVVVVGWAFWKNNQNMMERVYADKPFWDETGSVTPQMRAFAKDFARTMQESYGLEARLRIRRTSVDRPQPQTGRLFLGLCPAKRQAVFVAPLEWDAQRTQELTEYLEHKHFERHWGADWQQGLKSALILIWNQQRDKSISLEEAAGEAPLVDETDGLDQTARAFVQRFAEALERDFGQTCRIRIFQDKVVVPDLDNRTMFIGLSPSRGEALVSFPPMMRRALGQEFERDMMRTHFPAHFASGDWPLGLKTALIQIWQTLAGEEFK
ncbi:MAG: hypothetical protein V3573_08265 [Desulfovibrionaceae bacterium]